MIDANDKIISGKERSCKSDIVRRKIVKDIADGIYTGQMPGVTILAQRYQVNPLTVCRAMDVLAKQGIVEKISRVGTFVKKKNRIAVLALYGEEEFQHYNDHHSFPSHPFMEAVLSGVNEYLNRQRCSLLAHSVSVADQDFINFILGQVDGVLVVSGIGVTEQDYEIFSSSNWVKLMGVQGVPRHAHHVTYDNYAIGEIAAEYLLKQNCSCYYYFGGRQHVYAQRYQSFSDRLAAAGKKAEIIELDSAMISNDELMYRAKEAFQQLLPGCGKAGMFLSSSSYAVPVYQLLYGMGITPVRDLPLITCENITAMLQGVSPQPAVIDLRIREIGQRGCELLENTIKKTNSGVFEKVVYTPLIKQNHKTK